MALATSLSRVRRSGFLLLLACLWLGAGGAVAQDTPPPTLDAMRAELNRIDKHLADADADTLARARQSAMTFQVQADALATSLEPELSSLDARIVELGAAPEDPAQEAAEVRKRRADLTARRNDVDAQIRQARLLAVEASQVADRVAQLRRNRFEVELFQRTAAPYSAEFWTSLASSWPSDSASWDALLADGGNAWATATAVGARGRFWLLTIIGLVVLGAGRWAGERFIRYKTTMTIPSGQLRRSALAFGIAALFTASTWICARLVYEGFAGANALTEQLVVLSQHAIGLLSFSALVAGLGRALLSRQNPSWRLAPVSDEIASALRFAPTLLAVAIFFSALIEFTTDLIRGSLPLSVATNTAGTLLLSAVLLYALVRIRRASRKVDATDPERRNERRELGLNIGVTLGWLALAVCLVGLITGYIALASFVAKQAVWALVVVSLLFLLLQLCDHFLTTALAADGLAGRALGAHFGLASRRLDQAAVLLSAAFRIILVLVAVSALIGADGVGPGDLLTQMQRALGSGIAIGELSISPGVVVRALLVLIVASFLFRLLKTWFSDKYLPTTELEPGMQVSLTSLVGYAGVIIAIAMALSAVGVGLEKVTWIASALSVGIGFGLQAIVQNFVSGLILLIERPVKVGDWVVVGDAEGDVRRINVRTTEIRTGDRVTILVPNSELITKVVRNRTNPIAEGLVKLLVPMPLNTDAALLKATLLELLAAHSEVLKDPAPSVFLDDVSGGRMLFNATAFVSSPRLAYAVRSDIMFELLRRLQDAKIPLYEPSSSASKPGVSP
ncbi:MAG: MscS Mechanosensitive ion channel [Verrucomicrobiaceae bacterium]|nr:MscS Mechanosensitive ion channel [Verrucomicrobiaceae bacterium]